MRAGVIDAPPTTSTPEWIEVTTSRLPATQACAAVEQRFGVLPLMEHFDQANDATAGIASGSMRGALGLFTPSHEPAWGAVPLTGEWIGGVVRVCGEVRLPHQDVDGAIVLVRVGETEQRLAWLDLHGEGIARGDASWLAIDGAAIDSALISRPVTLAPGTEPYRQLEEYASVWALAAVHICRRIVLALRRATRTTRGRGLEPLRASQLITSSITEVEIETELATAAARHEMPGLVLASAAARTLVSATTLVRRLHDHMGLPCDPWLSDAMTPALITYLGGPLMLENEVARTRGLGRVSAGKTR